MAVLAGGKPAVTGRHGWPAGLRASAFLLVPLLALVAGVFAVHAAYDGRAVPGVRVADVAIGGLGADAIRATLANEASRPWAASRVLLTVEGQTFTATNAELGISPDLDAATAAALAYGRSGDLAQRVRQWAAAIRGETSLPFVMRAESATADRYLARIAASVDRPAQDGEIAVTATGATIREPAIGRELDRTHALSALLSAQALGDREVALRSRSLYPAVDDAGIREAAAFVRAATTPLEITAGDRGAREDAAGLVTLLRVERLVATAAELPPVPQGSVAPATRYRYVASLDDARVRAWAAAVAVAMDRPARSATYTVAADGSLVVVPSQDGVRIDVDAFVAQALGELAKPISDATRVLSPTFVRDVPRFTTEQAEQYRTGMRRAASFETFFPANLARWKNISIGAAQFNNVVLAPGDTFSFWARLGPVTVARGYAYAGAIIDGRSDPNVIGGGLCQVSTTMFMAVAQSGFQILERGNHDYYIDRYPLGLDAAVFDPGLDLKWKNDTAFPVLIRSSSSNIAVEFEIWTVPNGRSVTFSAPVETNWRDVAPDQPADSAFPPGVKVMGRDVTRVRTVAENGRIVHRDVFFSRYNPVWGGPAAAPPAP